jgi:hypothetical protein
MKKALVRITGKALADFLGVDGRVVAVFQDTHDMMHDSFSLKLEGVGEQTPEGGAIRYWILGENTLRKEAADGPPPA